VGENTKKEEGLVANSTNPLLYLIQ